MTLSYSGNVVVVVEGAVVVGAVVVVEVVVVVAVVVAGPVVGGGWVVSTVVAGSTLVGVTPGTSIEGAAVVAGVVALVGGTVELVSLGAPPPQPAATNARTTKTETTRRMATALMPASSARR
jgi:hypothetical protein